MWIFLGLFLCILQYYEDLKVSCSSTLHCRCSKPMTSCSCVQYYTTKPPCFLKLKIYETTSLTFNSVSETINGGYDIFFTWHSWSTLAFFLKFFLALTEGAQSVHHLLHTHLGSRQSTSIQHNLWNTEQK